MKRSILLIATLLTGSFTGCSKTPELPENPIIFEKMTNKSEGYVYLTADGKSYVPYCPFKRRYMGECIGYYDSVGDEFTENTRTYVYEFKGYSSDEWIVDYSPDINEGMVMRELKATDIPKGLESEYEWNKR